MCFESGTICLQSNTVSEYIYVLLISLDQKPIVKFVWPNCTYMMYIHLTHFIRSIPAGGVALQYSPTPRSVNSSSGKAESFSFLHILHENNILLHVYVYTYMYMYIYMYSTAETEVHVR